MNSAYKIPLDEKTYFVNFSGGRSSGFMLYQILKQNNGLPVNTFAVFANTGREMPQTLDFVNECSCKFGVDITWLEYTFDKNASGGKSDPKHKHKVVNHATASRNGEPFEAMIKARNYLPNVVSRICTSELKVKLIKRFAKRSLSVKESSVINVLGIRYDEPQRWNKATFQHCDTIFPMVYAKHTKKDVFDFWDGQDFDLRLDRNGYLGNCDLCFLKGKGKLKSIINHYPHLAGWWVEQEQHVLKQKGVKLQHKYMAQFNKNFSYQDLIDSVEHQPEIDFIGQAEVDCFCGD